LSIGFKSHKLPENDYNILKEKKKSISSAASNSTAGTLTNTTATNLTKKALQKDGHKKSHSLYNKKIVDIINGL
jgi:hypothetical protein